MKGPNVTEISNAQNPAATSDAAPKGARARPVVSIAIDQIEVGARLRHLRPEKVDEIAESIAAQSLLQSIIVRRRGAGYELVAGLHRLEASRKCGHEAIRAEICDTATSDDEAALIQIDENLCRAELSPAESAAHYAERKRLFERLHPEIGHGGDRRSADARSSSHSENLKAFVEDTAAKTGKGRSTIAREAKRGADIRDVAQLAGTSLDSGVELDAMARLPEAEQRALATAAKVGETVSARQRAKKLKRTSKGKAKPAAKDIALSEFDDHVLRLLQMTGKAKPARFARTSVDVDKLLQLSRFLAEVAGQQPQCADGHPAA
jgi:ParB-like chromosome segregation protein Spo0J